jgi:hypothetical protein
MNIKDFMEVVNYRITEGDSFGWQCFGENAYNISAWNGKNDGWSFNMVFDTSDQTVYSVEACDYKRRRAYRFINPDYLKTYHIYGKTKHAEYYNQAWDEVNFTDLEVEQDWLKKAKDIVMDKDYDTRVEVPLDLDDKELFNLMKMAHERDITLNQLVAEILQAAIDSFEKTQTS